MKLTADMVCEMDTGDKRQTFPAAREAFYHTFKALPAIEKAQTWVTLDTATKMDLVSLAAIENDKFYDMQTAIAGLDARYSEMLAREASLQATSATLKAEKPAQAHLVDKALERAREGAQISQVDGVYLVPSNTSDEVYHTTATSCDCPARKGCHHRYLVRLLIALPRYTRIVARRNLVEA